MLNPKEIRKRREWNEDRKGQIEVKQHDDRFKSTTSIITVNENGLKFSMKRQTVKMDKKGRPSYLPPIKKMHFKCKNYKCVKRPEI